MTKRQHSNEPASNGLTRRELCADLEAAGVRFDPRQAPDQLLAQRDEARSKG